MDTSTLWWIIFVVAGLFGLWISFSRKQTVMDRSKWLFALPLLGVAVVTLLQTGALGGLGVGPLFSAGGNLAVPSGAEGTPTGQVITQALPSGSCPGVEDTTVKLLGVDFWTSAASGGNHRYKVNSGAATTVADAGTFTASPGNILDILWMNASTSSLFSLPTQVQVPCSGTFDVTQQLKNNGSLTSSVYNTNEQLLTTTGVNQTLGANDLQTVRIKLTTGSRTAYPYGFLAVVEWNKTAIDNVKLFKDGAEFAGGGAVPNDHTQVWNIGGNEASKTYILPEELSGDLTDGFQYKAEIDTGVTNPTVTGLANITITYYPRNYFIYELQGGAYSGPAAVDEDSALTRASAGTSVIFYN